MRERIRVLLWLFALTLALALLWQRIRIVLMVHVGWWQLVAMILLVAAIIYLLLDHLFERLGR